MKLLGVSKIIQLAKLYPAAVMPELTHQSLPIPVATSKGLVLTFLYCHAEIEEAAKGYQLWPPNHRATMNAETGKFEELATVTSSSFNLPHPMDKPIGNYAHVAERMEDAFLNLLVAFYQTYDTVLHAFAGGEQLTSQEIKQAARDFERFFSEVAEKPLGPYYQVIGKDFFQWIAAATR